VRLLRAAGYRTQAAIVTGWIDQPRCIGFLHQVALLGDDLVVDVTARQFDPNLPLPWAARTAEHWAHLAAATGVAAVTIEPDGSAAAPQLSDTLDTTDTARTAGSDGV
jgi:hypothetical protein